METLYFNFNNEANTTEFYQEGTTVSFMGQTFESVEEFAEFYALARDVKPENLKNWVLLQDGNTYSYVLRAGTAGSDMDDFDFDVDSDIPTVEEFLNNLDDETVESAWDDLVNDYLNEYLVTEGQLTASDVKSAIHNEDYFDMVSDTIYDVYMDDEFEDKNYYIVRSILEFFVSDLCSEKRDQYHEFLNLATIYELESNTCNKFEYGSVRDGHRDAINKRYKVSSLAGRNTLQVIHLKPKVLYSTQEPVITYKKQTHEELFNELTENTTLTILFNRIFCITRPEGD